ncbi:MAG: DUF2779 domain-containing protein [Clostridiales bacterium]|nr:DUF2779 domain-containing protein [Clostridiales bacterium]
MCWLQKHKPEEQKFDDSTVARMKAGSDVGELAKRLFGEYADATVEKADGGLDCSAMIEKTKKLLADGTATICEAAFSFDGLYCAVDILHREGDGYAMYEVKSTAAVKDYHYSDVAYQKYVLENCGVKVTGAHVVILNSGYVRHGELDIKQLFSVDGGSDISAQIAAEYAAVADNLKRAEKIISLADEPNVGIGRQCGNCGYWKYCSRHLPEPSVLDLYSFSKKWDCYDAGIVSFEDVVKSGVKLNDIQRRQIDYALHDRGVYVDKQAIRAFLQTLSYPLCFLDFETMQQYVPEYDGVSPFDHIPFQYSLHTVEREGGEVKHAEFLAECGVDPRRALAEKLCEDIPQDACTLAYNASTERGIVGRLAEMFPDLRERLLSIQSGIADLLPVFKKGYYYKREMGGSFSIKSVLPAVFPELDYHNLDGVQNGTEAMNAFPILQDLPPDEAEILREQLLKYCERDTFAMVKLWQELVRVSK